MFKLCVFLAILACAAAAPAPAPSSGLAILPATYALPAALPVSSSSQSFVRNHNTFAAAPLAYPAQLTYAYAAAPTYYF